MHPAFAFAFSTTTILPCLGPHPTSGPWRPECCTLTTLCNCLAADVQVAIVFISMHLFLSMP